MEANVIHQALGNIDLYLLDQILKGRFAPGMRLLDAGCGEGRNLYWFLNNDFNVYAIDTHPSAITMVRMLAKGHPAEHFQVAAVEEMPFAEAHFDVVICNAVLHFARDKAHFHAMMKELVRVLKPGGTLFIRNASDAGWEGKLQSLEEEGRFLLPDGSERYVMARKEVENLLITYQLEPLEPIKHVVVEGARSMSVMSLKKKV
jgi:tellurite methyltransferase